MALNDVAPEEYARRAGVQTVENQSSKWSEKPKRIIPDWQPVYFVQENWYMRSYVPRYRYDRDNGGDDDHDGDRGHGMGHNDD